MVSSRVLIRVIGLVSTVVLVRLLRPEDFGLVTLAMALVGVLEVCGEFNFDLALIREGRATRDHYDTVWTLSLIRGALVSVALVLLAAPAAHFFGDPRIQAVIYCFAIMPFLEGMQNVGIVDFRKELNFHREFTLQVAVKLITFVVTLTFAILWRQYWALVIGIVVGKVINVGLTYGMHPYRPRPSLSEWRSLVGFSKWLLLHNISSFLTERFDTFAIGRIVGTYAVGLYDVANEIASLPKGELIWPIQRALFPGYAKLMEERDHLASSYLGSLGVITMIALPAAVGIACVAHLIVDVFLGPQWQNALPLLRVLAIAGILNVAYVNAQTALLALGRAQILSYLSLINLAIFVPLVVVGTLLAGPVGTAFAVVTTAAILLVIYIAITLRVLSTRFSELMTAIWRSLASAVLMALSLHALMAAFPETQSSFSEAVELLVCIAAGALIYVGAHLALWRLVGLPPGAEMHLLGALASLTQRWRARLGWGSTDAPTP